MANHAEDTLCAVCESAGAINIDGHSTEEHREIVEPFKPTIGERLEEACTCAHAGKCEACLDVAMAFAESAHE